ncbi:MAG TPA: OmpH family outer membrane protein [Gammaproteobacteria bacterium]|jgi:outer membrane protein|nr:OmpH family outer membrane protein [Gammaproteobacteria bacterium]
MINEGVASRSRSLTGARRLAFKSLWLTAFGVALLAAGAASAQGNLKIGVINVSKLLENAPQSKLVQEKLQKEFEPRQLAIRAKQQKLQTQQDSFQKDAAVMGEEERQNLERQIRDVQRDLQRDENEYLEDLNARRNEEVGKLQRDVYLRVQAYASAQKYDLVIADPIYAGSAVDITQAVITALQAAGPAAAPGAAAPAKKP